VNYLLDANAVIAVLKRRPTSVRERLRHALDTGDAVAVSSVVLFELWYGVAKSQRRQENAERLRIFLSGQIDVVQFVDDDAPLAGELRAMLEASGTSIGPYDLLSAAQARRIGAVLVTANVSEFSRVPDLVWEDWSVAN